MGAGVDVGFGAEAQPRNRREDDGSQQDHRRVEAENRGDHARSGEDKREQRDGPSARTGCHPRTRCIEEPVAVAEVGENEHSGEKANRRRETLRLGTGLIQRQHPEDKKEGGSRDGHNGFGQSSRTHDGAAQCRNEQQDCQRLCKGTRHVARQRTAPVRAGEPVRRLL